MVYHDIQYHFGTEEMITRKIGDPGQKTVDTTHVRICNLSTNTEPLMFLHKLILNHLRFTQTCKNRVVSTLTHTVEPLTLNTNSEHTKE